jgi:hypothetical protein
MKGKIISEIKPLQEVLVLESQSLFSEIKIAKKTMTFFLLQE